MLEPESQVGSSLLRQASSDIQGPRTWPLKDKLSMQTEIKMFSDPQYPSTNTQLLGSLPLKRTGGGRWRLLVASIRKSGMMSRLQVVEL